VLFGFNHDCGGFYALTDLPMVYLDLSHELLHFFMPNHGKLWKSLMRAHLGEYEAAEAELKKKTAHTHSE
jgi:predicted metal-dependent hydrolase